MKIPYQFTSIELSMEKLRALQIKVLTNSLTKDDIKLLDACLSYLAVNYIK